MTGSNKRRLIINADDLGFSDGINEAIFRAHTEGIVTSASLCANMPAARDAAVRAHDFPELGVGVHLNVVRGGPLAMIQHVPRLVTHSGKFRHGIAHFVKVSLLNDKRTLRNVENEYRDQIEQMLEWGIHPTHLDGEQHHFAVPALYRVACRLAREYNIPALRLPVEPFWMGAPHRHFSDMVKSVALRILCMRGRSILSYYGRRSPDYFYGGAHIGRISADLIRRLARALPAGTHELMTHPGLPGASLKTQARSYLDPQREAEFAALTAPDVREGLAEAGIELVNFSVFRGQTRNSA